MSESEEHEASRETEQRRGGKKLTSIFLIYIWFVSSYIYGSSGIYGSFEIHSVLKPFV